jgi:hypothetical protein
MIISILVNYVNSSANCWCGRGVITERIEKQNIVSSRRNVLPSIEIPGNGRNPVGKKQPPSKMDPEIWCAAAGRRTCTHTPQCLRWLPPPNTGGGKKIGCAPGAPQPRCAPRRDGHASVSDVQAVRCRPPLHPWPPSAQWERLRSPHGLSPTTWQTECSLSFVS